MLAVTVISPDSLKQRMSRESTLALECPLVNGA